MFKRKASDKNFDFRAVGMGCSMGDVEAMYQMSRWFRSRLTTEFLDLEKMLEESSDGQQEGEIRRETARGSFSQYVAEHKKEAFWWRAANFWMNRAALYGHAKARELAEAHKLRCLNAYLSPYAMLPMAQNGISCTGEELNRLGLLQFTASEEYDLGGMGKDGTYRARIYRGYDGPDETGFGMEEQWDDYYYDEFFNLLKKDRQSALKEEQEKRRRYWNQPWNSRDGQAYSSGILEMQLQILRDNKLILCMGIRHVTVPEGVTSIGNHAFYRNHTVETIALSSSVREVGHYAFSDCDNLRQVILPAGLKKLGERVFFHSHALETVQLPEGLEEIGEGTFLGCNALRTICIPQSVKQIGKSAFMYCEAMEQAILPAALRRIEEDTFFLCKKLSRVDMPQNLEYIGKQAFYRCPCENTIAKKYPHLYQPDEKQKKLRGLF